MEGTPYVHRMTKQVQQDQAKGLGYGGRALRNMNYFDRWVGQVLDETSNYYLVAWRPEADAEKLAKFRAVIAVSKLSHIGNGDDAELADFCHKRPLGGAQVVGAIRLSDSLA